MLVLLDNATAEYVFVSNFFAPPSSSSELPSRTPAPMPSPAYSIRDRRPSVVTDVHDGTHDDILVGHSAKESVDNSAIFSLQQERSKEELAAIAVIWKQIMEPALHHCQVCQHSMYSYTY